MNHISLQNDRKRRRQAQFITFLVTTTTLTGVAYGIGALDQLVELVQLYFAAPAPVEVDPSPVASLF